MTLENRGRLLDEPALVFDGINPPHAQQHLPATDSGKSRARFVAMISAIRVGENAVRLHEGSLARMPLAEQRRLFFVAGDDRVRVGEEAAGAQHETDDLAPLPTAARLPGQI